jgi:hypothetical protein
MNAHYILLLLKLCIFSILFKLGRDELNNQQDDEDGVFDKQPKNGSVM